MNKMSRFAISLLVVSFLSAGGITGALVMVNASPDTTIAISPASQSVGVGDTFTVDVYVDPDQPIRGVQCSLTFNSSLLQAEQVTEGDIFSGYTTFFIGGNIHNASGEIRGIANMIFGDGNTSTEGTFATITFEAIAAGTATIAFNMSDDNTVIVTGDSQTVEPAPSDGTVTVTEEPNTPPSCTLTASPTAGAPPLDVTFTMSATDTDGTIQAWELDINNDGTPEYQGTGTPPASQEHTYTTTGTYTARLTVTDDDSATGDDTAIVTVSEGNQPPTTTITDAPSGTIYYRDVSFTWTGTDDSTPTQDLEYAYMLEGPQRDSEWSRWTSETSAEYSGLEVGSYTFSAKARDAEKLEGAPDTASFTVADDTPPVISAVTATPSLQVVNNSVNISCTVTDDFSVKSVSVHIVFPNAMTTNSTMASGEGDSYYYQTTYQQTGTHTFTIWAFDASGNGVSAQGTFEITDEDTTPPHITDVTVSPSTVEAGENVVITANVTDDLSLADVRLALTYPDDSTENVSIFQNVSGIEAMTYYCQQPYYDLGNYTFYIYAVDDAGNGNTSQEETFTVQDTTPPAFSNVAATPAAATYNAAVNLSATVTDAVGVQDVFLKIIDPDDDVTNTSILEQVVNDTYYSETSYTTLGTYEYSFYAVDGEGNGNTSSIKTFKVEDVTPPEVTLTAPNGGENISGDVDITWNATDTATANDSALEVTLKYSADEGVSWQTIVADTANDGTYEWDTDGLDDGTEYLLKISVSDPSNNDGTDISDAVFTVDNTAPVVTLEKPTANNLYLFDREILPVLRAKAVIVGQITVSVSASDATSGMDRVSFLVDGVEKASDGTAPYEWLWDDTVLFSHTLKIVAYDNAGNRAEQSVSVSVYNI